MAYKPYVDYTWYINVYDGEILTAENAEKYLKNASRHVDDLTFNRIVGVGIENLTDFQQDVVKETICRLADFENQNEEAINTMLSSYSINGVSMSFGDSWNVTMKNGVAMPRDLYSFLSKSGLTCRNTRRYYDIS